MKLKENSLSLSNLHIAVARCHVNSFVRKVPWVLRLIEKQTACNRINIENQEIGEGDLDEVVESVDKLETSEKKKNENKKQGKK
ncbi:hypothetical protein CRE_16099 [Caenorhabditis remanei]|uniref:Uncharacterized protein n=1 Tax=Caenorhabditis remanei TaxID=31234 RepID=E3MBU7_CAERE|nr:hypothetical protein CRE_16099 [Caenorhabditis remanei]